MVIFGAELIIIIAILLIETSLLNYCLLIKKYRFCGSYQINTKNVFYLVAITFEKINDNVQFIYKFVHHELVPFGAVSFFTGMNK